MRAHADVLMHGGDMDDAPLAWRMEGEAYEPESDDDSSDEEEVRLSRMKHMKESALLAFS